MRREGDRRTTEGEVKDAEGLQRREERKRREEKGKKMMGQIDK